MKSNYDILGNHIRLIDTRNRESITDRVLGINIDKGDKERIVYFDARTKIHLQNYLNSRKDDNPALFVSLQSPYNRMNIGGIEVRLRQLGELRKSEVMEVLYERERKNYPIMV